MRSKVQFDLNSLNEAVITAKIALTDDVRDKIAKSFTEKMGYNSILATVYFVGHDTFRDEEGIDRDMSTVEIKGVGGLESDNDGLAALMSDVQLEGLFTAIKREIRFRKRTGSGNKSYYYGQPVKDEVRVYLPEDSE